jgi:hypothetical protein
VVIASATRNHRLAARAWPDSVARRVVSRSS